jgi:hypothetical protein
MHLSQMKFQGVTRSNLSEPMQAKVRQWRDGVLNPTPDTKWGLWIFGQRLSGTSYVGKAVAADLTFNHVTSYSEHVTAAALIRQLRATWNISQQTRQNSDDIALYWEAQQAEDAINQYFFGDQLLWIDDLHDETIDWNIWRKHIQPLVEERVKAEMATIVCTTLDPGDDSLPKGLIDGLFMTAHCTGFRPDGAG